MNRVALLLIASAFALGACKKDENKDSAGKASAEKKVEHGKAVGKGTGGGDKTATGSKDGKVGSGKGAVDHGKGEGKGTGGGDKSATGSKDGKVGSGDGKVIERGKYLASLGGCALCHTPMGPTGPDMSKVFGGGMKMTEKMPGGAEMTWIGPNITSHDTGIGKWTDEQIMAAIREGVRPDGSKLLPIMPYALYNGLTDDDARAMVAFLRAVPPVDQKVEKSPAQLPPEAYPPVGKPANKPVGDDPIAKGAYLASLMHCVMCHTPYTDKGPDMSKAFAGGMEMHLPPEMGTGVLYTSNLTSDPETGIGKWTEPQIIDAVRKATRPDGKPIFGPMMFYVPLWSQMTDDDAMALAKFIKSLPPVKNKVKPSEFKLNGPPPGAPPQ